MLQKALCGKMFEAGAPQRQCLCVEWLVRPSDRLHDGQQLRTRSCRGNLPTADLAGHSVTGVQRNRTRSEPKPALNKAKFLQSLFIQKCPFKEFEKRKIDNNKVAIPDIMTLPAPPTQQLTPPTQQPIEEG
ncbi:hypothetical protein MTO96_000513 [Rhipicephalus appendiculatus]